MLKLSIMSEEELTHIFGDLDSYIPLHEGKSSNSESLEFAEEYLAPMLYYFGRKHFLRHSW